MFNLVRTKLSGEASSTACHYAYVQIASRVIRLTQSGVGIWRRIAKTSYNVG